MRVSDSFSEWGTHVCQHTLRAGLLSVRKIGFLQAQPEATDDIPCTSGARTRVKGAQVRRHGSTDLCSWDFSTPAPSPFPGGPLCRPPLSNAYPFPLSVHGLAASSCYSQFCSVTPNPGHLSPLPCELPQNPFKIGSQLDHYIFLFLLQHGSLSLSFKKQRGTLF